MAGGVTVVIPTGGRGRLHLLDVMLGWLRGCDAVDQIILSEFGETACSLDIARRWQADHVLTARAGPYDLGAARNAGIPLARCDTIMWCDGDLIFRPDFVRRAEHELSARDLDFLAPFAAIDYLDEAHSDAVIAGHAAPWDCPPIRVLGSMWNGASGGIFLIRRAFLRRHGGTPAGFAGWGCEDCAWLHKASLLGRTAATDQADQRAWHLFHPDGGSHSDTAAQHAKQANPQFARNQALLDRMLAIADRDGWERAFPPPSHAALPWPDGARATFVAFDDDLAASWAARLDAIYAVAPPVLRSVPDALPAADVIVGFAHAADDHAVFAASATGVTMLVVDGTVPVAPWGEGIPPLLLVRHADDIAAWRAAGYPVWHRPWDEAADADVAPVVVQPLSHVLAGQRDPLNCVPEAAPPSTGQRDWRVRIVIDRAALGAPALDRPRFWYVGLHDADDVELAREDLRGRELHDMVGIGDGPVVIDRALRSTRRPVRWTVWPVDRGGYWLNPLSGEIGGDDMKQEGRA